MNTRQPRQYGLTLIELLLILAILGILATILFPVFVRPHCHSNTRLSSCQSNLKQIALGLLQYTQDYDGRLPLKNLSNRPGPAPHYNPPFGWADAIHPYTRSNEILQCPSEGGRARIDATRSGFSDYWLNANLSGTQRAKIARPSITFLAGDGNDGSDRSNARYARSFLPPTWLKGQSSPASRHCDDRANYAFVDGHVKWLKPDYFTDPPADKPHYSFVKLITK